MSGDRQRKTVKELIDVVDVMIGEQRRLIRVIEDLKKEHEELKDEIKIQNFVLNSIPFRSEMLN